MKKKLLFLAIFAFVGFITLQIPVNKLAGSSVSFTLFDFFGPIAGAFLGPVLGILSVLVVELTNIVISHAPVTTGTVIRLFPTLFACLYFALMTKKSSQSRWILIFPLLAIASFVINPVGRQVWYYSLFWLIPLVAYFKRNNLFVRSLGATFTAHAVGGAAWIWVFHLPVSVWKGLIPVVIEERLLFTVGIALSYLGMKYTLSFLMKKHILPRLESVVPSV